MKKILHLLLYISLFCISSCSTEELLSSDTKKSSASEKLLFMRSKQKVALIAVALNTVEKEGFIGNENKIENFLRLSYNDTIYSISDSIINNVLKRNLKSKFEYTNTDSMEKDLIMYHKYIIKLSYEKKFTPKCLSIVNDFFIQSSKYKQDKSQKQSKVRKKSKCATYKVKAWFMGSADVMEFECPDDMVLLDAAEMEGFDWPYSSRAGASYNELAILKSGTVDQSSQYLLDDEEINMGFILTDSAYPTSDVVIMLTPEWECVAEWPDPEWPDPFPPTPPSTGGTPSTPPSGGGAPNVPQIIPRTDCTASTTLNATIVKNSLNDNSSPYPNQVVSTNVSTLCGYATQSSEYGMTINSDGTDYWVVKDNATGQTIFTNNSSVSYYYSYTNNTYMICHTHPSSSLSSPSPSDAYTLCNAYNGNAINIYANVIFASNGNQYTVYISDRNAFTSFTTNTNNASFFNTSGGSMFAPGSIYASYYTSVYSNLTSQGYSQTDANSYALTYVLDKYNTGIKIAVRSNNTVEFKEQKTEFGNSNYQPKKCP